MLSLLLGNALRREVMRILLSMGRYPEDKLSVSL
ncbi:MAG: hypothetical protein CM15mP68_2840 [Pseudomonadota bacterium]|nr:MAG: hypothetical protein CM15mP68_2840 [Pseudomonadota bacterium]